MKGLWARGGRRLFEAGEYSLCSAHGVIELAHFSAGGASQPVSWV